jgi:hypothetical protein
MLPVLHLLIAEVPPISERPRSFVLSLAPSDAAPGGHCVRTTHQMKGPSKSSPLRVVDAQKELYDLHHCAALCANAKFESILNDRSISI